jgi:hypothetical protein
MVFKFSAVYSIFFDFFFFLHKHKPATSSATYKKCPSVCWDTLGNAHKGSCIFLEQRLNYIGDRLKQKKMLSTAWSMGDPLVTSWQPTANTSTGLPAGWHVSANIGHAAFNFLQAPRSFKCCSMRNRRRTGKFWKPSEVLLSSGMPNILFSAKLKLVRQSL